MRRVSCAPWARLYEQGDIDEADRLFDECHVLGAEGGAVDFMLLTHWTEPCG